MARNDNRWRPWGLDVEFQCLNTECPGQSWDVPWQDNGNHNAKHQVCNACGQRSKWVKYETVQGKYTNLLFRDVYWTPWPLPMELAGLGHLDLGPAENVKANKDKDKVEGESSQQGASEGKKRKGRTSGEGVVDNKKQKGGSRP